LSSVLNAAYYRKVDLRAHERIKELVAEQWRIHCPISFNLVATAATRLAKESKNNQFTILPSEADIFMAFNECLPKNTKIVLIGKRPIIGGNGKCFDFPVGSKIPPSLRHIINDVYKDTGRKSLALTNGNTYLRHLPKQGVLMLNYSLTRYLENEISHRRYWSEFSISLVKEMQSLKDVTFVVTDSSIDISKYISKFNHLHYYFPGQPSNGLFLKLSEKYNIIF